MISWHKLDTFVFENPTFKVEYPDFFTVDTTELNEGRMSFRYVINGYFVVLRGFSSPRYELWDTNSVADSVESYLAELGNDTITMRDLHPGYFYLEGRSKKNEYKYYEQYVLGDEDIYIFELAYSPKLTDEQVKRLKELVHEWSPK